MGFHVVEAEPDSLEVINLYTGTIAMVGCNDNNIGGVR